MKPILKPLAFSVLFICFCFAANAQSTVADSLRIAGGVEILGGNGTFGSSYKFGAGASLRVDVPVIRKFYATASVGYNNFFVTNAARTTSQAIMNVTPPNFETIPLKLGIKWFLFSQFYLQGEAGETILANKSALYAIYSNAFTWSPQIGMIFPLKKRHTYIDAGVRYEGVSSFYNDSNKNNFWGAHIAYAFNL